MYYKGKKIRESSLKTSNIHVLPWHVCTCTCIHAYASTHLCEPEHMLVQVLGHRIWKSLSSQTKFHFCIGIFVYLFLFHLPSIVIHLVKNIEIFLGISSSENVSAQIYWVEWQNTCVLQRKERRENCGCAL